MILATWNVQGLSSKQPNVFRVRGKKNRYMYYHRSQEERKRKYIHIYSEESKGKSAKRGVSVANPKTLKNNRGVK